MDWMDVKDRLPEYSDTVLFWWRPIDGNSSAEGCIIGKMSFYKEQETNKKVIWANGRYYDIGTYITHWTPLPEPPKEEE